MMSNENLQIWNIVKQVPPAFLKPISFGKLKGKSDINPQWRLMAMTQAFGMVGHGWTYRIVRTWNEQAPDGSMMCFAEVAVKTKHNSEWGEEFSGIGGSSTVEKNKNGLVANDDGYKMAVTDALSVAFKAIGIAADIYMGNYDDSKYQYKQDISMAYLEQAPQSQVFLMTQVHVNELKNILASMPAEKQQAVEKQYPDFSKVQDSEFDNIKGRMIKTIKNLGLTA